MATNMTGVLADTPLDTLQPYHQNPRRGDTQAIADSLERNGQYRPIVVNKGTHTSRPNEVLAGNHTLAAAQQLGWKTIATYIIDVDDETATRIVLADNRTADLGTYDDDTLLELLETIDHDLDGTGYTYDDLEALQALNAGAPTLEDLEAEYGEPQASDTHITIRIPASPTTAQQWEQYQHGFNTPEEALENLLDQAE